MLWEPPGKGRRSHKRVWDLPVGLAEGSQHVGHTGQQVPPHSGAAATQELPKPRVAQRDGDSTAEARSYRICCASGRVSVCLTTLLLAHRFHLCLWWALAPVCTHTYRCVRYAGRWRFQSFPSLFRFKPSQLDSSWVAAQTQERRKKERETVAISCPGMRP